MRKLPFPAKNRQAVYTFCCQFFPDFRKFMTKTGTGDRLNDLCKSKMFAKYEKIKFMTFYFYNFSQVFQFPPQNIIFMK